MKEGDRWNVTIPPHLAFGERGSQSRRIQDGVVVNYEIELVAVKHKGTFEFFGVDFGGDQVQKTVATLIAYALTLYLVGGNLFSNCYDLAEAMSEENVCVFLEVQIGAEQAEPAGRIEIELFSKFCPKAVENFRCLCTGEKLS